MLASSMRLCAAAQLSLGSMFAATANQTMRIVLLGGATLISISPSPAFAQENDTETWIGATASGSISGPVLGSLEAMLRMDDAHMRQPTRIFRPMLGYKIKKLSLWLGYTRVEQFPSARPQTVENRLFQQLNWDTGKLGLVHLSYRTRLEQRHFSTARGSAWRMRHQIKATAPLPASKISLVATTEPFLTLKTSVAGDSSGLEQWRNSLGISIPLSHKVALEAGYLNRYIIRRGAPDKIDHVFPLTLAYRF